MADEQSEVNVDEVVRAAEQFASVVEKNLAAARAGKRHLLAQALSTVFRGGKAVANVLGSAIDTEKQQAVVQAANLKNTVQQLEQAKQDLQAAVKPEAPKEPVVAAAPKQQS